MRLLIYFEIVTYSIMMSFCRCVSKRQIYLDGKTSLAHARCTHFSQVINLKNKIIYTVGNVLNIYIHWI